jgi:hypothetical protein
VANNSILGILVRDIPTLEKYDEPFQPALIFHILNSLDIDNYISLESYPETSPTSLSSKKV